jgi:ElaB/YqjD/DUF883 family membrane-anchored ribosome-binding protein
MDKSTFTHNPTDAARLGSPATAPMSGEQSAAAGHWSAGDSAHDTLSRTRHVAHDAVDRLASGASRLVERIDDKAQGLTEGPRRAWAYSRHVVQDHPIQAVAVSLLAGYAIARLLAMRNWRG